MLRAVVKNVDPGRQNLPTERRARELAVLTPEQQRKVTSKLDYSTDTVRDVGKMSTQRTSPNTALLSH